MRFRTKVILIIAIIILAVLIIPQIAGATIGTYERGRNIILYQICENCTGNNISRVLFPNSSIAIANITMDKDDTYYSYNFTNTTTLGEYIVNGYGDLDGVKTSWVYSFEITGTGFEFTESRSIFYVALLILLFVFFFIVLFGISKLPNRNETDDYGMLLSISKLKYLRPIFYVIAWVLLLGIVFTSSNIALAYLGSEMFGNLLFMIYRIMFLMTLPGVIIWGIFILVQIFRDAEMKRMLERGIDIQQP